jgi:hypothetical protein
VNREEARLELDATTLRPQDASPEARAQAANDPELAAWLEQRTAFDESVADAFQNLPVAPGLRESILSAAYARPHKSTRWLTPTLIAAAACLAFGWTLFWPGNSAMAAWESESLAAVAKVEYGVLKLDEHAATLEAVKKLLNATGCPCPETVPTKLAGLPTYGCKRIRVDGRAATIICFELESGKEAHLVVMSSHPNSKYAKRSVAGPGAVEEALDVATQECLHAGRPGLDIVCGDINMARPPLSSFR